MMIGAVMFLGGFFTSLLAFYGRNAPLLMLRYYACFLLGRQRAGSQGFPCYSYHVGFVAWYFRNKSVSCFYF